MAKRVVLAYSGGLDTSVAVRWLGEELGVEVIALAADRFGIPITVTKASPYSVDQNLWGRTVECGILEDPWQQPPEEVFELTTPTATEPVEMVVRFEQGVPVAVNNQRMALASIIAQVTTVVGSYGWGRVDMIENRRVGIKSREIYEVPGALALLMAHADLEDLTLERDLAHEKARLEPRYAELVYDGLWFSPLRQALDAFVDESQRSVTGEVRLKCEVPGRCFVAGRRSEVGLYDYNLATYEAADRFRHEDAEGFVRLWGLGLQTWAARQAGRGDAEE